MKFSGLRRVLTTSAMIMEVVFLHVSLIFAARPVAGLSVREKSGTRGPQQQKKRSRLVSMKTTSTAAKKHYNRAKRRILRAPATSTLSSDKNASDTRSSSSSSFTSLNVINMASKDIRTTQSPPRALVENQEGSPPVQPPPPSSLSSSSELDAPSTSLTPLSGVLTASNQVPVQGACENCVGCGGDEEEATTSEEIGITTTTTSTTTAEDEDDATTSSTEAATTSSPLQPPALALEWTIDVRCVSEAQGGCPEEPTTGRPMDCFEPCGMQFRLAGTGSQCANWCLVGEDGNDELPQGLAPGSYKSACCKYDRETETVPYADAEKYPECQALTIPGLPVEQTVPAEVLAYGGNETSFHSCVALPAWVLNKKHPQAFTKNLFASDTTPLPPTAISCLPGCNGTPGSCAACYPEGTTPAAGTAHAQYEAACCKKGAQQAADVSSAASEEVDVCSRASIFPLADRISDPGQYPFECVMVNSNGADSTLSTSTTSSTTSTTTWPFENPDSTNYRLALSCPGDDLDAFLDCFVPWDKVGDPTGGAVDYKKGWEMKDDLITLRDNPDENAVMKKQVSVDFHKGKITTHANDDWNNHRPAIRMHTKYAVGAGSLFVVDVERIPTIDASWSAYWTAHKGGIVPLAWDTGFQPGDGFGHSGWPESGEFDMMEHLHGFVNTEMITTVHSGATSYNSHSCQVWPSRGGTLGDSEPSSQEVTDANEECKANHHALWNMTEGCKLPTFLKETSCYGNLGCGAYVRDVPNGVPFNKQRGGIHLMQLEEDEVKKFYFIPRNDVDPEVFTEEKTKQGWFWTEKLRPLTPYVVFPVNKNKNCNAQQLFRTQTLVLNTAFCGEWAGFTYNWGPRENDHPPVPSDLTTDEAREHWKATKWRENCNALMKDAAYGYKTQESKFADLGEVLWDSEEGEPDQGIGTNFLFNSIKIFSKKWTEGGGLGESFYHWADDRMLDGSEEPQRDWKDKYPALFPDGV
ncbi:unnamed protein product [Amoebophrya sp. A120]|nr:unnamed protein product [Amoebophrya sp. A120]|eukprot:GSA120T00020457001.1